MGVCIYQTSSNGAFNIYVFYCIIKFTSNQKVIYKYQTLYLFLFWTVLGLHCCAQTVSNCSE